MTPRGEPTTPPRTGEIVELVALGGHGERLFARRLGGRRSLLVAPLGGRQIPVAAERFRLEVAESWRAGAWHRLRGTLSGVRLDLAALGLTPLALAERGPWDAGRDQLTAVRLAPPRRRELEMERVPPAGAGASGAERTLLRALDLWSDGHRTAAGDLLGQLLRRDLRCLEAHSCLGFFAFNAPAGDRDPERARRHYEAGLRIGELSLGERFRGVLPWSRPGNRPFLRCLYGHSTCLWRLGDLAAARAGFERLCRLNPGDQLAARLALERIERAGG